MYMKPEHKVSLDRAFATAFHKLPEYYFSAPGRTELGGNHTDHQGGKVLAAAVDLHVRAAVAVNGTARIRVVSDLFSDFEIDINELSPRPEEHNSACALLRGMAAAFAKRGCRLSGFELCCETDVLPGSGLSSSAAFEVLLGRVMNSLFFGGCATAEDIARMGQWAENEYFGKPCGLMDQMACAVGGLVSMDFAAEGEPLVKTVAFDFSACGHALCIIDTRASHAQLNHEYAAIPAEMRSIAAYFGKTVLSELDEAEFYAAIPALRQRCGDRAVLRAMHFFAENRRVPQQVAALEKGDFDGFLELVKESGRSSWMLLQNICPPGETVQQAMALSLALCDRLLNGRGACRVHGGGFAGTAQAFVPLDMLAEFCAGIDAVLGEGACRVMRLISE